MGGRWRNVALGLGTAGLIAALVPVSGMGHASAPARPAQAPVPTGVDPDALAAQCKAQRLGSPAQMRCATDAIPRIQARLNELGASPGNEQALSRAMLRLGEMGILGLGPNVGPETKPSKLLLQPGPSQPLREADDAHTPAGRKRNVKTSDFHPITVTCALGVGKVRNYQGTQRPAGVANSICNTVTTTHTVSVLLYRYSGGWYVDASNAAGGPPSLQTIAVSHNKCGNYYAYGQHYYAATGHVPPSATSAADTPTDYWCNT